ncbi:hypothetical protein Gotri_007885 [Gossypium trilobum]|uniref:Uncharacterized protein n=1 Tax=Gossypium trilobum TaxID=34281 RepID=A0A7J9EI60_9ROSI|nr:hypothetical protein [Gossypium trilobum]
MAKIEESNIVVGVGLEDVGGSLFEIFIDGKLFPDLSGLQPDLWEDPKWDVLSFLVQYLLAFGIVFAFFRTLPCATVMGCAWEPTTMTHLCDPSSGKEVIWPDQTDLLLEVIEGSSTSLTHMEA